MANIKITDLTAYTDPATTDVVPIVDVGNDTTKKVSVGEVVGKISGDVDVATDGTATISELPVSKLADGAARQLLQTDAAGTGVEWTSDVDVPGTLDVTGAATLDSTLDVTGLISADGKVSFPLGTAAAPSLYPGSDTDTGIYSPGADQVAISTNGAQALYIDSDGDILVADGNRMEIDEIRARDGDGLKLFDDGGAGIFIEDGGNVGINTTSPSTPLHVASTSGTQLTLERTGSASDYSLKFTRGNKTDQGIYTDGAGIALRGTDASNGYTQVRIAGQNINANDFDRIEFYVEGSERARIDSSGKFIVKGVGTEAFSVDGGAPNNSLIVDSSGRCLVGTSSALNSADIVSVDGQLAAGGQRMASLEKTVTVGNSVTFDIAGSFNVLAKVLIVVGYFGNNSYQMHAQYDYVSCNSLTSGSTATLTEILQVEAGNAQFNYTDLTVSRPSNATVRITYAPTSGAGTHTPRIYVDGLFTSLA